MTNKTNSVDTNITIKQIILNFFSLQNGEAIKASIVANVLGMTTKNLLSYLWCLEKRDDRIIYFFEKEGIVVKLV